MWPQEGSTTKAEPPSGAISVHFKVYPGKHGPGARHWRGVCKPETFFHLQSTGWKKVDPC